MSDPTSPGTLMAAEMREQPRVLADLADRRTEIATAVTAVVPDDLAGVVLVARGSSDHAAVHARYLLEHVTGRPVALAAPSLHTRYDHRARLDGWLAVGVSQSGRTPEIVQTLASLGRAGARTLAVTNDGASPLADAAHGAVALAAGEERAVPATKTFTAQLAAFAHVAAALGTVPWPEGSWTEVTEAVRTVLADPQPAARLAAQLVDADELFTVGRGFLYPAALETALKIAETTGMHSSGWSSADLLHGPIAMAGPGLHALCLATPGPVAQDVAEVAAELGRRGVTVHAVTDDDQLLPTAAGRLAVPAGVPEALTPIVHVVRGQQLARALAIARDIDPDQPRGLAKVTPTT